MSHEKTGLQKLGMVVAGGGMAVSAYLLGEGIYDKVSALNEADYVNEVCVHKSQDERTPAEEDYCTPFPDIFEISHAGSISLSEGMEDSSIPFLISVAGMSIATRAGKKD